MRRSHLASGSSQEIRKPLQSGTDAQPDLSMRRPRWSRVVAASAHPVESKHRTATTTSLWKKAKERNAVRARASPSISLPKACTQLPSDSTQEKLPVKPSWRVQRRSIGLWQLSCNPLPPHRGKRVHRICPSLGVARHNSSLCPPPQAAREARHKRTTKSVRATQGSCGSSSRIHALRGPTPAAGGHNGPVLVRRAAGRRRHPGSAAGGHRPVRGRLRRRAAPA